MPEKPRCFVDITRFVSLRDEPCTYQPSPEEYMEIEHLREFVEVVYCTSFTKAAKRLHVSQPSLSKHIAALEQECKTPLTDKSNAELQLTFAGEILFEKAISLIEEHDSTLSRIRSLSTMPHIAIGGLYNNQNVLDLVNLSLEHSKKDADEFIVSYRDYPRSSYNDLLQCGAIDLVITILAQTDALPDDISKEFLFSDPMVCLVKENNELFDKEVLHVSDLEGQTIMRPVGTYSSQHGVSTVKHIFDSHSINPVQRPTFIRSISELATVRNDSCVLIMEESMLRTQPFSTEYKVLPFAEENACFNFYAIYLNNTSNEGVPRFVSMLAKTAKTISA